MKNFIAFLILAIAAAMVTWIDNAIGLKWAILSVIGFGLGFTLSFSRFGIAFGWREMITKRSSYHVRIHLITILTEIVFFTVCLSFAHALFNGDMVGNVSPIGVPFIVGAFLFGIGMQLAGVCASGTLYCCGEGNPRAWIVFIFFGVGTIISNHWKKPLNETFHSQVVMAKDLTGNIWSGMFLNLALLALLFVLFVYTEYKKHGKIMPVFNTKELFWKDGRFTILTGGLIIAVLNSSVVAINGKAWTITGAIYNMSVHFANLFGFESSSPLLQVPLFKDPMVGMFFLGLLGATFSRCIIGNQNQTPVKVGSSMAAVLGGLLLGLGGVFAGCNLGGFFDGTASGSLHGWVWMLMALAGSFIGIRLRPVFKMA
ncbi:MAG: YeeE/YedE thiosulfate transporter family protein [Vibrio sp.]